MKIEARNIVKNRNLKFTSGVEIWEGEERG
jgi:hypothetical protein